MKGKYLVYILLSFSCLFPFSVNAECDYQRKAELSRIASNVQFSYNYDENNDFTVNITNLTDDIYIKDDYDNYMSGVGEKQYSYNNGDTIRYTIYSNDNNCKDEEIMTRYLSLPYYNPYSDTSECKEHPDFKYCQRWSNSSVDFDKFNNELIKYKNELHANDDNNDTNISIVESIIDYFKNNIYVIFVIIISLIIIIMIFIMHKFRRKK